MPTRRFKPDYQDDLARYYQDELRYLKDLGTEHANEDPSRAHFDFGAVEDPDVLCLLKGFSFLTARIRQQLDDGLPEISHSLLELLFPHYLRPIPSMTVAQFKPKPGALQARTTIPRETSVLARPIDEEVCRFRTSFAVDVVPVQIDSLRLERADGRGGVLRLSLSAVGPADLAKVNLSTLRLFLRDGEQEDRAATLLWLLCEHIAKMTVEWDAESGRRSVARDPKASIRHVGFEAEELGEEATSLLPFPPRSFAGFRLLQEYFALPSKFQFLDLVLTDHPDGAVFGDDGKVRSFEIAFQIDDLPSGLPQLDEGMLALFCTPVVNLYEHDTEPIVLDHARTEYVLRPRDGNRKRREIWSVERVMAIEPVRRELPDFFSFHSSASAPRGAAIFYEARRRPAAFGPVDDDGERVADRPSTDTFLRFVTADNDPADPSAPIGPLPASALPAAEKLSIDILCSDRFLPRELKPSDICVPSDELPLGVTVMAIEPITPNVAPPLGSLMQWRLVSHLALNRLSLDTPDALRGLLEIYDFNARTSPASMRASRRRLDAIQGVEIRLSRAFRGGAPLRVVETILTVDEGGFRGPGEMYIFGAVLSRFFSLYVATNCLSRLTVKVAATDNEFRFAARAGTEVLA